jgi:starch phosphorylase
MLLADFEDYATCQQRVSSAFADAKKWHTMAVRNIAKSGRFSSDRTIDEYAKDIWGVTPVHVQLRDGKLESW